ncbi:hypothetical protein JKP88DRAFT_268903 [Tribonema minus]|uniref:tRNA-binding domain-containing protein n=1 Tax=Tribonema minus TaxID=303371 RepID=A0A835ZED8_9STRA|nr:hypothetical protein JKP88DRAFT_268903 [Tribonema minus]
MEPALVKCVAALCGVELPAAAATDGLTALRQLCSEAGPKGATLLGSSPLLKAQIDSWLDIVASGPISAHTASLDDHLSLRSYLVGPGLTLADAAVYIAIAQGQLDSKHTNVLRWALHCQCLISSACNECPPLQVTASPPREPVTLPVPKGKPAAAAGGATGAKAAPADQKAKSDAANDAGAAAAAGGAGTGEGKAKQGEEDGKGKKGGEAAAKKKKEKKPAAGDAAAAAPAPATDGAATGSDEADPTKLDIRVGVITKVWKHPDSEKLYCEEIDVGEDKPRQIASGLQAFYALEEMENRRVLVLANLKPRPLAGFKSEGMVLCASNADHTVVKFVNPPEGAPAGACITFPGRAGEPATPAQIQKKKIMEKVMPLMKTDDAGVPGFDGCPFTVEDFGACSSEVPGAAVA